MSNILDLKRVKVFAIIVLAVALLATFGMVAIQKASADTTPLSSCPTLKAGSTSHDCVMTLQATLNSNGAALTVDGAFGPRTKAAVMTYQSAHGLVADGIVGPMTKAALMGSVSGNFPAGCTSAAGFSTTTGMPCNSGPSMGFPAGCSSAVGFSVTTGMPCSGNFPSGCTSAVGYSPTTGVKCDSTVSSSVSSGTNGYLADIAADSSNRVSTVYESETDKVVAGVRATARLADQTVNRIRVTFVNTNTLSSANLGKYITSASLWYGSTKLATMPIAMADRATSSDTYTFNFSGLTAKIPKDAVGRFYVSVNANGSLDSVDATNASWTVTFVAGGISASSPDGSYDTYPTNDIVQTGVKFGKFASSGVKATVSLSSTNPAATTLAVNNTAATNGVTLLKFTIKATNSDLTLRKVPIQVVTNGNNVSAIINTIKLYKGSTLLDSLDGGAGTHVSVGGGGAGTADETAVNPVGSISVSGTGAGVCTTTCGFIFSNLSSPDNKTASGSTDEFSVVVDIKAQSNFTAGDTIKASLQNADVLIANNFSVQDVNGDQLPANSSVRVGSAVGEVMTLLVNGINVTQGAASIDTTTNTSGQITSATYTIPLTATSFGQTLYVGQTAQLVAPIVATGTNAFAFALQASTSTTDIAACTGCTITQSLSSSDATIEGSGFRLDSGTTKHFTLTVNLVHTVGAGAGFYRVHVGQVMTWTDNALTQNQSNQNLLPVQNFETNYQKVD